VIVLPDEVRDGRLGIVSASVVNHDNTIGFASLRQQTLNRISQE
jgi:hypothetical protein